MSFEDLRRLFESYLQAERFNRPPEVLYGPNNYILSQGGKRLRPVLVLLACDIAGGRAEQALNAALAVEYLHNYTLIHDDIMDQAATRRGKSTVHEKYGVNEAILSGDVLMIYAYQYLCTYPPKLLSRLMETMNRAAIEVCEGQSHDMAYERTKEVSEEQYLEMIRLKTAVLIGAALKIGALVGGASTRETRHLSDFGAHLGMAFQIQDDLLDAYGGEKFGKRIGGDILQNKKTLLLLHALRSARAAGDAELDDWLNRDDYRDRDKISAVLALYGQYGSREYTEALRDEYRQKAERSLSASGISDRRLKRLTDLLICRDH